MKSLAEQLSVYAAYHRDSNNKAIHALFVPLITWSSMGLLSFSIPQPLVGFDITPALLVSLAVLAYYLALDFSMGITLTLAFSLLLIMAAQVHAAAPGFAWIFFAVVFVASWVAQLVGHRYWEGRKPALTNNLFQILIAPLFVASEAMFALGMRKELAAQVEKGMQAHIPKSGA